MAGIIFSENSMQNDAVYGKYQAPIRLMIEKKAEQFEKESKISELFSVQKSTHFGEAYTSMTGMDDWLPVGENGSHPENGMRQGRDKLLVNETWKSAFSISREMVDDSNLIELRRRPAAFVAAYGRAKERFAASLYGAAMDGKTEITINGKRFDCCTADGKALFAVDHPALCKGKAQSNLYAGDFSASNLSVLEEKMQNFKGENGELLNICPDTILIPNNGALKQKVFAAIGADKDPATANNAFNVQFGRWNVIVWNYLNEHVRGTPWVLLDSNYLKDNMAAVFQNRVDMEVTSSIDRDTNANRWDGYARFTAGFVDWRYACIGGISSGTALS